MCYRVVSGMASSTMPAASAGTVTGRLNRARESANEVKWPELLDKFKQTQERARRRNERLLRGADADTPLNGGPTRGLLDGAEAGRTSRSSGRDEVEGKGRNGTRPLSMLGPSGGPGGLVKAGSGLSLSTGGGQSATGGDRTAPHKRGHSLAGGLGKFVSRAGGSRDRDKGKK